MKNFIPILLILLPSLACAQAQSPNASPTAAPAAPPQEQKPATGQPGSLADAARQARAKKPAATTKDKRIYTDDDLDQGTPSTEKPAADHPATSASNERERFRAWKASAEQYRGVLHAMEAEPEQEAIRDALSGFADSKFPQRDSWERRFLAARAVFLRGLQLCMSDRASDSDAKMAACDRAPSQEAAYESLKREGLKQASYWDHYQSEKR